MNNEILKDYSQEEIEALAIKQLENDDFDEDIPLKITKIDKEYKRHNTKAITKAIINGTIILTCAGIVLSSDATLSNFGTDDLMNVFDKITQSMSFLPGSDTFIAVYTKMFDGISSIIDKMGLMGIILASKSVKFVLLTIKDTKKTIKIKKELSELKKTIEEKQLDNNYAK